MSPQARRTWEKSESVALEASCHPVVCIPGQPGGGQWGDTLDGVGVCDTGVSGLRPEHPACGSLVGNPSLRRFHGSVSGGGGGASCLPRVPSRLPRLGNGAYRGGAAHPWEEEGGDCFELCMSPACSSSLARTAGFSALE